MPHVPARIRKCLPAVTLLAAACAAAPAQAQVTGTQITTPADPSHVLFYTSGPRTLAVTGTATGSGAVDLICVRGQELYRLGGSAENVPVAADGTFSVANASLDQPADRLNPEQTARTCRLHAVPAGASPADLRPYRGPALHITKFSLLQLSGTGGSNDGLPAGYYLYAAGHGRAIESGAFGACGVGSLSESFTTFEPLAWGIECSGSPTDRAQGGKAAIEIDGGPAYPPAAVDGGVGGAGVQGNAGFPRFEIPDVQFDKETGAVAVEETSALAKCAPDNAYPVTILGCHHFEDVPVKVTRTTAVAADRRHTTVVDRWSSTDGRPHRLDLRLFQAACLSVGDDCSEQVTYRFPGETSYSRHDANDATPRTGIVPGPFESRHPIFTRDATEALRGGGAIIPEQRADRARFVDDDAFVLEYDALTIPAGGELKLIHHYVTTSDAAEVEPLAAALIAGLPQPAPASGGSAAPRSTAVSPPAGPRLIRNGRARVRRAGRTFIVTTGDRVRCAAGCAVSVRTSAGGRRVGSSRLQIAAGRSAAIRVRLNARGARHLRRHGRLRLAVVVSARSGSDAPVTQRRSVTVRTGTS